MTDEPRKILILSSAPGKIGNTQSELCVRLRYPAKGCARGKQAGSFSMRTVRFAKVLPRRRRREQMCVCGYGKRSKNVQKNR